jgi:NADPH:quinone reductase-like Zn-dependent oxidoreductase
MKMLGASQVFDYHSTTIRDNLMAAFKGKTIAGVLDFIGGEATAVCTDVVHKSGSDKFVATTKPILPTPPEGVGIKHISRTSTKGHEVGNTMRTSCRPR